MRASTAAPTQAPVRRDAVVLLEFDGGHAVATRRCIDGVWHDLPIPHPRASESLHALATATSETTRGVTDTWIAWRDRAVADNLIPPERWPALCHSRLEMIHVGGIQRTDRAAASLGFVDFDTPYLRRAPSREPFATWLAGPGAGLIHTSALVACAFDPRLDLPLALVEVAHRGQCVGLRPRAEPRLATTSEAAVPTARLFDSSQTATLIRRLYGHRWLGFWLFAGLLFDRRLRGLAALRAACSQGPPVIDAEALTTLAPGSEDQDLNDSITTVIPTLGRPQHVVDVVRDLAAQTHPPTQTIIVEQGVEAGATDLHELDAIDVPFAIERISVTWSGACRGRNVGLEKATGDWVLLLDDDVRLKPNVIAGLLRTARDHGVSSVQARVVQHDEQPSALKRETTGPPRPWPNFASGAALVTRQAIVRAGGFDIRHEGGFGEDYEYGVRLLRSGVETLRDEGVRILHLKAPRGGFRQPLAQPWDDEPVAPKPSPTVLYSRARHLTLPQRQGYRLFYTIKRLLARSILVWPAELLRVQRQWRVAQRWCDTLLQKADIPADTTKDPV